MPSFDQHITQAKVNLNFLQESNILKGYWDWQITISFYTALHIVNAHLAKTLNFQYSTHVKTKNAIAPESLSPARLDNETYTSYVALQNLSKRSRYLCNHKNTTAADQAFFTNEKHLSKAIKHLDVIMEYAKKKYKTKFNEISINNIHLKQSNVVNFNVSDL
ncbi:MAG: hypothetical protein JEY96_01500 [Bacteroidales bacterium]|nr:hypothetical protein [Bacteroidales bacterium]